MKLTNKDTSDFTSMIYPQATILGSDLPDPDDENIVTSKQCIPVINNDDSSDLTIAIKPLAQQIAIDAGLTQQEYFTYTIPAGKEWIGTPFQQIDSSQCSANYNSSNIKYHLGIC